MQVNTVLPSDLEGGAQRPSAHRPVEKSRTSLLSVLLLLVLLIPGCETGSEVGLRPDTADGGAMMDRLIASGSIQASEVRLASEWEGASLRSLRRLGMRSKQARLWWFWMRHPFCCNYPRPRPPLRRQDQTWMRFGQDQESRRCLLSRLRWH